MSAYIQIIFLIFYITTSQQSIYKKINDNALSNFDKRGKGITRQLKNVKLGHNKFDDDKKTILSFIRNTVDKSNAKTNSENVIPIKHSHDENSRFFEESRKKDKYNRRKPIHIKANGNSKMKPIKRRKYTDSSQSSSSSLELKEWKDEWREHWIKKKLEAINSSRPRGDVVNMVAARPWGVPCGDPNQHDMPWGSCMLAMECDAEYRIYRGDHFCGRSQFVCCALELNTYDMYQGFDVSFADSSLSTDSEEIKNRNRGSRERRRRKRRKERRRRKRDRLKRKRKIKKNIRKIIREIRKILHKSYRNGTTQRKRKTKQLKKFVKDLKKQYRKDRNSVKTIHEVEMIKIDTALQKKLNQIMNMNRDFIRNSTFRNIVVNGTINKQGARMLLQAYPELSSYIDARRTGNANEQQDYLGYDIEYGLLYY